MDAFVVFKENKVQKWNGLKYYLKEKNKQVSLYTLINYMR